MGVGKVKHGLSYHPLYKTWVGMVARCNNPKNSAYDRYGDRGIKVCDRWLDVANFVEDMYPSHEKGLELDRRDNSGGYELGNCRWVTPKQNSCNRRSNRVEVVRGKEYPLHQLADLAKKRGIGRSTFYQRINVYGWSIERAIMTPPRGLKKSSK